MSRWNLPPWVSLALAVAGPVAAATWWVQSKQVEQTEQVRELRVATMARLDAIYYEFCPDGVNANAPINDSHRCPPSCP